MERKPGPNASRNYPFVDYLKNERCPWAWQLTMASNSKSCAAFISNPFGSNCFKRRGSGLGVTGPSIVHGACSWQVPDHSMLNNRYLRTHCVTTFRNRNGFSQTSCSFPHPSYPDPKRFDVLSEPKRTPAMHSKHLACKERSTNAPMQTVFPLTLDPHTRPCTSQATARHLKHPHPALQFTPTPTPT